MIEVILQEFKAYLQVSDWIPLLSVNKAGKLKICNFNYNKISRSELFLYMILTEQNINWNKALFQSFTAPI